MIIEELIGVLGWDLKGEEDLKKFKQGMADAERGMARFVSRMATFAVAAATAFAGGTALLGKSVVSVSAQFEKMEATLTTIEGSADKAKASLDWVAQFAKDTPFELQEVSEAFIRLRAYGLDPMDGTLKSVGDAASAMGKSLMDGVEAIADATTNENERLKSFGITASTAGDKITYTWRQNGKEFSKTLKKSGIEIAKFLNENFGARFSGAMVRQSKTWNGMVSNLGDSWIDFQRRIGDAGFFDAVKGQLGRLMDYIGRLDADGSLDKWAKSLSNGLTWGVDQAGFAFSRLQRHFKSISEWIENNSSSWDKLKYALLAIAAIKFPFITAILAVEEVLTWMEGGDSIIGDFANSLSELTGVDANKIGAIMAALGGGAAVLTTLGLLTPAVKGLAGAVGLFGTGAVALGTNNLLRLMGGVGVGVAGEAAILNAGKSSIMNDPKMRQRTEEGNAWIDRMRQKVNGTGQEGSFDQGRFGSGMPPYIESEALRNYIANLQKTRSGDAATAAVQNTVTDNSRGPVSVTVNQTVQQATQAPTAAANATASAVSGAAQSSSAPPARVVGGGF